MIQRATKADLPAIQAFLHRTPHQAMFPLANLLNHPFEGDHKHSMSFWFRRDKQGITDVLGISRGGMVMPKCPTGPIVEPLADRALTGMIGPYDDCMALRVAAGMTDVPCTLDRAEPHFDLDLVDLIIPDTTATAIPFAQAPKELMMAWQVDYDVETLGATPEAAKARADEVYDIHVASGSHIVLEKDGEYLSKAGLNAQLPNIVQVGGVYTPPEHRSNGYARQITALLLEQARARGVEKATLFTSGEIAAKAYEAIGFKRLPSEWALILFDGEQRATL